MGVREGVLEESLVEDDVSVVVLESVDSGLAGDDRVGAGVSLENVEEGTAEGVEEVSEVEDTISELEE